MTQFACTVAAIACWYAFSGLIVVFVFTRPGALTRAPGSPPMSRAAWTVIGLMWPWFYARWTYNTLKDGR